MDGSEKLRFSAKDADNVGVECHLDWRVLPLISFRAGLGRLDLQNPPTSFLIHMEISNLEKQLGFLSDACAQLQASLRAIVGIVKETQPTVAVGSQTLQVHSYYNAAGNKDSVCHYCGLRIDHPVHNLGIQMEGPIHSWFGAKGSNLGLGDIGPKKYSPEDVDFSNCVRSLEASAVRYYVCCESGNNNEGNALLWLDGAREHLAKVHKACVAVARAKGQAPNRQQVEVAINVLCQEAMMHGKADALAVGVHSSLSRMLSARHQLMVLLFGDDIGQYGVEQGKPADPAPPIDTTTSKAYRPGASPTVKVEKTKEERTADFEKALARVIDAATSFKYRKADVNDGRDGTRAFDEARAELLRLFDPNLSVVPESSEVCHDFQQEYWRTIHEFEKAIETLVLDHDKGKSNEEMSNTRKNCF